MSALFALVASALWGSADFLGGTLTRRNTALDVVLSTQAVALVVLLVWAPLSGDLQLTGAHVAWSVAAGLVGLLALGSFYRALADGTMGVVAPIAATGVVLPLAVGMLTGDRPSTLQLVGIGCAVTGVVAAGGPDFRAARDGRASRRPLALAVVAALGFGAIMWFIAEGGETSLVTTLLGMRLTSVVCLVAVALAIRRGPRLAVVDLPWVVLVGVLDLGANAAYGVATQDSTLSIAAVLASLYPVVTVLLARRFHAERLSRTQTVGATAAILGSALIAFS